MPDTVNFKGNPLHLEGTEVKLGEKAPDFTARKSLAEDVSLSALAAGKTAIISSIPSIDTGVCDMQTRRFNDEASKLGDDVVIITVSCDLPPAQARWCGAAGVENLVMLSDYMHHDFGARYGLKIKELGVNSRAVFVVAADGTLKHVEYVGEVTEHPNYEAALAAAKG
ncbi:thiol peroxidase [bacterium]|nr:thiol peroxidase [bacterium]